MGVGHWALKVLNWNVAGCRQKPTTLFDIVNTDSECHNTLKITNKKRKHQKQNNI